MKRSAASQQFALLAQRTCGPVAGQAELCKLALTRALGVLVEQFRLCLYLGADNAGTELQLSGAGECLRPHQ